MEPALIPFQDMTAFSHFAQNFSSTQLLSSCEGQPTSLVVGDNRIISLLFPTAPESPLSDLYGTEIPQESFREIIAAATSRFDANDQRDRYLAAAKGLPKISATQVEIDSAAFVKDPLNMIQEFAKKFVSSRINQALLHKPAYAKFSEILLLQEISTAVTPFFDPDFIPSINYATVRPQMALIQPVIDQLGYMQRSIS